MLSLNVAAAALVVAFQATAVAQPASRAFDNSNRVAATSVVTSKDHIDAARRALMNGEFDVARREFVIAVALDRDAGRLPAEAAFGLAHCLYSQTFNREAAVVMNQLADEASAAGDVETEAKALADAVWLHVDSKQYAKAREDAARLRKLSTDARLTTETRKLIKARIG